MSKEIILSNGAKALIDALDYENVSQYSWHIRVQYQATHTTCYATTKIKGKAITMHRLILGATNMKQVVYHENGDGLDNRRCNLMLTTITLNSANRPPRENCSSKYKGVSKPYKCLDEYIACITKEGVRYPLGKFTSEIEAARAYNIKALELFGDFAWLNDV